MMRTAARIAGVIVFTFLTACSASSQVVNVWPGVAPGSENWTQKERMIDNTPVGTVIFNVVTPTLTAYLPERGKATGTGVIIAPGGAFVALAISLEGNDVARWLPPNNRMHPTPLHEAPLTPPPLNVSRTPNYSYHRSVGASESRVV